MDAPHGRPMKLRIEMQLGVDLDVQTIDRRSPVSAPCWPSSPHVALQLRAITGHNATRQRSMLAVIAPCCLTIEGRHRPMLPYNVQRHRPMLPYNVQRHRPMLPYNVQRHLPMLPYNVQRHRPMLPYNVQQFKDLCKSNAVRKIVSNLN